MIPIYIILILLALISIFFLLMFVLIEDNRSNKVMEDNISDYCEIYKREVKYLKKKIKKQYKIIKELEKN